MVREHVNHLAVRVCEPDIVLEEVAVAVDVGHHELLGQNRVRLEQVRVAGVGVDDHLVDLLKAVGVAPC